MPSVKVFLFPQRSCLGKLTQVPLVHSPGPRAPSRLGKKKAAQKEAKCSREQIVKKKNANTESTASAYLQFSSQPLFPTICWITIKRIKIYLITTFHLLFWTIGLDQKILASYGNIWACTWWGFEEEEDGKENGISCLGFFVLIVNKKKNKQVWPSRTCLIPHCCTSLCESPPQQLILEFSADSFLSWLYRMSSVICLKQDF